FAAHYEKLMEAERINAKESTPERPPKDRGRGR
ncbi:MAG: hypothetical protein RL367_2741, partial [Pseudomonadota bacterium]